MFESVPFCRVNCKCSIPDVQKESWGEGGKKKKNSQPTSMEFQKGISFHSWRSGITVVVRKARKPLLSSGEPLQLNDCPSFRSFYPLPSPFTFLLAQFFFSLLLSAFFIFYLHFLLPFLRLYAIISRSSISPLVHVFALHNYRDN